MIEGSEETHKWIQLDGLRAFAVAGVVYLHWMPKEYIFNIPTGGLGVLLFFVLSGYLITGIIYRNSNFPHFFANFYARRALRILPPYYLALSTISIFSSMPAKYSIINFLYLNNVQIFIDNRWVPGVAQYTAHFWSLSVEEQFYLVWPLSLFLIPRKKQPFLMAAIILTSILARIYFGATRPDLRFVHFLPIVAFDGMAAGALLAFHQQEGGSLQGFGVRMLGLVGGLSLMVEIALRVFGTRSYVLGVLTEISALAFFVYLVAGAVNGFSGPWGAILRSRPITFLGQISYGIYIYHFYARRLFYALLKLSHLPLDWRFGARGILGQLLVTLTVATLSWYLLERPILRLKKYFKYRRTTSGDTDAVGISLLTTHDNQGHMADADGANA